VKINKAELFNRSSSLASV